MTKDLSTQIAHSIRESIIDGELIIGARLPSELELAEKYDVSRSTIREALKRLAAQSLIRTQRGAGGGAFVNQLTYEDAYPQQITTSTLLLSMNEVSIETACEARFALERSCTELAAKNRKPAHLDAMKAEIKRQTEDALSDENFCASDVAFHRALVDSTDNPILSYQLAGAVEAMQPLMNMITFTARDRVKIVTLHQHIMDAIAAQDAAAADRELAELEAYTIALANEVIEQRRSQQLS